MARLTSRSGRLSGEETYPAPRGSRLPALRIGQERRQAHPPRQPFQFRGGVEQRLDVDRRPAAALEERRSFFWRELERRACPLETLLQAAAPLHHAHERRRHH